MTETDRPKRWTRVDRTEPGLHPSIYEDFCFYYLQRTSEGYENPSNQRLINLKHDPMEYRDREDVWRYKTEEITKFGNDVAGWLAAALVPFELWDDVALVPMPTSRPSTDEFFDSRLVELCEVAACVDGRARVENILDVSTGTVPAHRGGSRDVAYLMDNIVVYEPSQPLDIVVLIDDILTSGNHYAASRARLRECFPSIMTMGLFLARHRDDVRYAYVVPDQ